MRDPLSLDVVVYTSETIEALLIPMCDEYDIPPVRKRLYVVFM